LRERPDLLHIVEILAVVGAGWGVYRAERRHNRNRSLKTLRLAIQDFIEAAHIGVINYKYDDGKKEIKFRNVVFDITVYETIVHSGLFTYFPREIQAPVMKLYTAIRTHNEYLKHRIELAERFSLYGSTARDAVFRKTLEKLEAYLTELNIDAESLIELIQVEQSKKWWQRLISFFY
jgi:hypothetical protein